MFNNIPNWLILVLICVAVLIGKLTAFTEVFTCDIKNNVCKVERNYSFNRSSTILKPSPKEIKDIKTQHIRKTIIKSKGGISFVDEYFLYLVTVDGKHDRIFSHNYIQEEKAIKAAEDIKMQLKYGVNPVFSKFER